MAERSTERYSFICRRRLRSTAMWLRRWLSISSVFFTAFGRRSRLRAAADAAAALPRADDEAATAEGTGGGGDTESWCCRSQHSSTAPPGAVEHGQSTASHSHVVPAPAPGGGSASAASPCRTTPALSSSSSVWKPQPSNAERALTVHARCSFGNTTASSAMAWPSLPSFLATTCHDLASTSRNELELHARQARAVTNAQLAGLPSPR